MKSSKNKVNYDDWALIMTAIISCIAILGLVFALKNGLTGNIFKDTNAQAIQITQPAYQGTPVFYCKDNNAFALWTKNAVNAVLKLDYSCTISDINKDVTCCTPPKQ